MTQKSLSTWTQFKKTSASLRHSLEKLSKEIAVTASSPSTDAITGYALVRSEIDAWIQTVQEALAEAERVSSLLKPKSIEQAESLDERLLRTLREDGYEIYGDSALFVVNGIVYVETDAKKGVVRVNNVLLSDASTDGARTQVATELDRLKKLMTPPEKLLTLLLRAYQAELAISKKDFGTQVPTNSVFWQVALLRQQSTFRSNPTAANFKEYPRETFRADLYDLLKANLTGVEQKRFCYASGSDTSGAVFMLVPQLGRPAHIGRIWFELSEN